MKLLLQHIRKSEDYLLDSVSPSYSNYSLEYIKEIDYNDEGRPCYGGISIKLIGMSLRNNDDDKVTFFYIIKDVGEKIQVERIRRLPKDLLTQFDGLPKHIKSLLKEAGLVSKL